MRKRVFAGLLSLLLLMSFVPTAMAEDIPQETYTPQPTESSEPTPEPTAESTPELTPEPSEEPSSKLTPEPTAKQTLESSLEPKPESSALSDEMMVTLEAESRDYEYVIYGGSATITKYKGEGGDITIPDTLGGYAVRTIGLVAFSECKNITSVVIPEGITSIDSYAFSICQNLISVTLPSSLTTMGDGVFSACGIVSIFIPANLRSMRNAVFSECDYLESIEVDPSNGYFFSENGVLYNKSKSKLIRYPQKKVGVYTIPDTVTQISGDAFEGCLSLTEVYVSESATSLGQGAFSDCSSLRSIYIPDGILEIPMWAFAGCTNLQNVRLPSDLIKIRDVAFAGCSSLEGILIPDSVNYIGNGAFQYCSSLSEITFPEGVTSFEPAVFHGCSSLKSFVIPDGINEIKFMAFEECTSLTSVTIPDSIKRVGSSAFSGCISIEHIDLPEDMDYIDFYAFRDCRALTSILLPETIDIIETGLFWGCRNLRSVNIPSGVTKILRFAFEDCNSLEEIIIPDGVTDIGIQAFQNCSSIEVIDLPDGICAIGEMTFSGCSSLKSIVIGDNVSTIGDFAFYRCSSLENVTIPTNMAQIKEGAFSMCKNLKSAHFTCDAPDMGDYVFGGCGDDFVIFYDGGASGYTNPWYGYPTALYDTNSYTITFDSQGGSSVPCATVRYYKMVTAPNSPIKAGYSFGGWFETSACDALSVSFPYKVMHDKTLYAKWIPNEYFVYFQSMGGSWLPSIRVLYGTEVYAPADPVKYNFVFTGWYYDVNCTSPVSFPYTVSGNKTLYAGWKKQTASCYLNNVITSCGTWNRLFSKTKTSYKINLVENQGSVTLTPVKEYDGAKMTIAGKAVTSYSVSVGNGKSKDVYVKVTYGRTTKTYKFTVTRAKSTNNNLATLTASKGTFDSAFNPSDMSYTLTLDEDAKSVKLYDTVASTYARASFKSKTVSLNNGQTKTVKLSVKSQAGKTKTYVITVIRAKSTNNNLSYLKTNSKSLPLSPKFGAGMTNYTITLPVNKSTVTISAKAAGYKAGVKIDGKSASSKKITLKAGTSQTVLIVVKAQSGAEKVYTITVNRLISTDANLKSLKTSSKSAPLSPVFSPGVTSYTVTLPAKTSSVTLSASANGYGAKVTIDGKSVSSKKITLKAGGEATVRIVVTAQNGNKKEYVITVKRP